VTHLGHGGLALEAPPHAVVNALGLPPARVDAFEAVALVAVEARRALLHDRHVGLCGDCIQALEALQYLSLAQLSLTHLCCCVSIRGEVVRRWCRSSKSRCVPSIALFNSISVRKMPSRVGAEPFRRRTPLHSEFFTTSTTLNIITSRHIAT
jgi:hypothetical protein